MDASARALLDMAVDADLHEDWQPAALWLRSSKAVKCMDSTMKYGETTCTEKALSMYVGKEVTLPPGYTTREVCEVAAENKSLLNVVWHSALPSEALLFATVKDATGQQAEKGCLLPIRIPDAVDTVESRMVDMAHILDTGISKLFLIIFNPALYPKGHCIVLQKAKGRWYLSDPHMPPQTCLVMPQPKDFLLLLMCSAAPIFGNVAPKTKK